MEEVLIVYCYDENKEAIHHSKTVRGGKYFCIDCGSELICKDGKVKVKHLSHKNTSNCGGTGESIFHKHWKENFFKAGMYINVANMISPPDNVEILDVLNEVSLRQRYIKDWDIDIIVDTLLVTEKGDIVVEINYTNPKDWDKLKPYYDELNLLRVYELTISKNINDPLIWFCLGEKEEVERILAEQKRIEEEKRKARERWKYEKQKEKERQRELARKEIQRLRDIEKKEIERLRNEQIQKQAKEMFELAEKLQQDLKNSKKVKVFFNKKTEFIKVDDTNFTLQCLLEVSPNKYEKINLRFNLDVLGGSESGLRNTFDVMYGIRYSYVVIGEKSDDGHDVFKFEYWKEAEYNKRLYANLCNIK